MLICDMEMNKSINLKRPCLSRCDAYVVLKASKVSMSFRSSLRYGQTLKSLSLMLGIIS